MKVLKCPGCDGAVVATTYRDAATLDDADDSQLLYYSCPLCGPGFQKGSDEAHQNEPTAETVALG